MHAHPARMCRAEGLTSVSFITTSDVKAQHGTLGCALRHRAAAENCSRRITTDISKASPMFRKLLRNETARLMALGFLIGTIGIGGAALMTGSPAEASASP